MARPDFAEAVARARHFEELEERQVAPRKVFDLDKIEYDAPKVRFALVSWRDDVVDARTGEVEDGRWIIVRASGQVGHDLHDWGVLFFGLPPWRRSQVLRVFGRLGSVEKAVSELAKPAADFSYGFVYDAPVAPVSVARVPLAAAVALKATPRQAPAVERRERWRRSQRPEAKRQGELF